jgi:hypothetical protein
MIVSFFKSLIKGCLCKCICLPEEEQNYVFYEWNKDVDYSYTEENIYF